MKQHMKSDQEIRKKLSKKSYLYLYALKHASERERDLFNHDPRLVSSIKEQIRICSVFWELNCLLIKLNHKFEKSIFSKENFQLFIGRFIATSKSLYRVNFLS